MNYRYHCEGFSNAIVPLFGGKPVPSTIRRCLLVFCCEFFY
jgi:hypothetical protein